MLFIKGLITFDDKGKIEIYRDNFYDPQLTSIQNDTRERNMLYQYLGSGNWYIQLDSDELFVNFKGFTEVLKANSKYLKNPEDIKIQICMFFINLYKKN